MVSPDLATALRECLAVLQQDAVSEVSGGDAVILVCSECRASRGLHLGDCRIASAIAVAQAALAAHEAGAASDDSWRGLAQELRVQESRISGIIMDADDIPTGNIVESVRQLVAERASVRAAERAAIVAWLRGVSDVMERARAGYVAHAMTELALHAGTEAITARRLADSIERGEHAGPKL